MKNVFFVAVLVLTVSNMVTAQQDPKAKEILDAMSSKYKMLSSFQADLAYTMINVTEGIDEAFKGRIAIKGDMYKLMMQDQVIYNDGISVWTYLPNLDVPEVTIDNNDPEGGDITPSSIFNIYQEGYKYLYLKSVTIEGKSYDIVDLIPDDKDSQYFKVRVEIGTKDRLLRTFTLFDKEGSEYSYLITNFRSGVDLPDSYFKFDTSKLKEDQIIDIR